MRARVIGIYTTDMNQLELHKPDNNERFCIWVRAIVGPEGEEGQESFDIGVCSPSWIAEACQTDGFLVGRHYLVVLRYDVYSIKRIIVDLIESCEGNSWHEVAERVARIGHWEFEDYHDRKDGAAAPGSPALH